MKTRVLLLSAVAACVFAAQAQNAQVMREGLAFGNSIAPTSKGQIVNPSATSSSAWSASTLPSSVPSGLGTFSKPLDGSTTFTQARSIGLSGLGNAAMDRCANYVPSGNPEADQECAAVNFLSQRCMAPRAGYPSSQSSMSGSCVGSYGSGQAQFDFATQVTSRDNIFENISGAQKDAQNSTGTTCKPHSAVTKPAEYDSATCIKSTNATAITCSQYLKANCTPLRDGCDSGGIIPNSWAGDMSSSFNGDGAGNFTLQFGTIGDNYWGSGQYDRTLNFSVKNTSLIKNFTLVRAAFDDWLLVKINDVLVYVGPYGGDRLEMYRSGFSYRVRYCETCTGSRELTTSWNVGLNIDLKPYLREGTNTIFTRTIVGGGGESTIWISTRQYCPQTCNVSWDNKCTDLENKSGVRLGSP